MFYQFHHLGSPDYLKVERGRDFSFPLHLHQCFEVIILLSGQMTVTVDNNEFLLNEKDGLLIFPNQIHALESTQSEHVLCIFSPRLVQAYATKVADKIPVNCKFQPHPYLTEQLKGLSITSSSVEKKGVLYSLCGQFDKTAEYCEKLSGGEKLLYQIFAFVEKEFSADCSLAKLSKVTGYDYSYLSRYFKKRIGISFNSYVTHYRISNACYLMENSQAPIIRCAYDSGFTSLRSFNRSFKEHLEITPTQYRKSTQT